MPPRLGRRTVASFGALSLYRIAEAVTTFFFDSVGGAILGVIVALFFDPIVDWALFLLVIYISTGELLSVVQDNRFERAVVAASATAYAIVWHAMYFRFAGPIPPTVEQSALRMAGVTIGTFVLLHSTRETSDDISRAGTLTVGCFALGLVGGLMAGLKPIPEILILVGIAWFGLDRSVSKLVHPNTSHGAIDIEDQLLRGILEATKNAKGRYALMITLTGFVTSMLFFIALVGMYYIDYGGSVPPSERGPFLIAGVPFTIYAAYGGWFWMRVLRRIPRFVHSWSGGAGDASVARPIGLFVPASIFSGGLFLIMSSSVLLGLIGLLIGFIAILVSIAETRKRRPQPLESDQYATPVAFVIQFIPFLYWGFPNTLVSLVVLPVVYFLPDVRENLPEESTLLLTGLLFFVFVGLVWPVSVGRLLALTVLPAEIALVTAMIESVSEYSENG